MSDQINLAGLGFAYAGLGRYDEAIRAMQGAEPDSAMTSNVVVGAAYAWAGQRERARTILRRVTDHSRREYVRALMQRAVARAN
jgi:tetratricopeptide (TPR) repeat protein